ncbi:MAG: NigD-like protein [Prevotellaceae bacterium]|nr:NigD-like protein [Prevotellaceae bacterium]
MRTLHNPFNKLLPLLAATLLLAACSGDDYHYPSVKLEFLTAYSDAGGALSRILTDDGELLPIVENASSLTTKADTILRIVANYETLTTDEGGPGAKIYALARTFSTVPVKAEEFEDELKTLPAGMVSIWPGLDYLNIVLTAKQQGTHTFYYIEQALTDDAQTGTRSVQLLLYHDSTSEAEDYSKRAYLSIPLQQYLTEGVQALALSFTLYTDEGTWETYNTTYPAE